MKSMYKKVSVFLLMLAATMPAYAISIGELFDNGADNLAQGGGFITGFFLLMGMFLVGLGLFKLKANRDNPQQNSLGTAIVLLVVGGLMTVILGLMTVAPDTLGLTDADGVSSLNSQSQDAPGLFD